MTDDRTVTWNGETYFTDPAELTMGELEVLGQRTDITGLSDLTARLRRTDHIGWKAIFWIQDRRRDADLRWDGYSGPTMRILLDAVDTWPDAGEEEPGKAQTEVAGSGPSPTSSATPPASSTS